MLNKGCIHLKIIMSFKYSTKNVQVIVVMKFCSIFVWQKKRIYATIKLFRICSFVLLFLANI